ncbi:MAG: RluA family pseudouridine synthase [Leptolyngbya sp. SIOISBB]|nr:RluA family pseudouridine synthase [Leptolyngbya sp. SIOISBB]
MNQGWIYHDRVPKTAVGQSLLDYYTKRYRHSSCDEWQSRIERGQITVDGQSAQAEQPLQANQQLAYYRAPWQEPAVPLDFEVLYEDDDVLAIAKPSGLPVLPGGNFLENTLLHQLKQRYPQAPPSPVHRLGRGTSGVMLLARSPLAKTELSRQLRQSSQGKNHAASFQKIYRALIGPSDLPDTFEVTTPIGPVPYPVLGTIYAAIPTGKWAYSRGQVLQRCDTQTLLEVTILTGRPHQIRIHLAAIGYPLLGDPLYAPGGLPRAVAASTKLPVPSDLGYHLHAYRLQFIHPRTQTSMQLTCLPPPCLQLSPS